MSCPQNCLILCLALCWEIDDSKCDILFSGGQFGPLQMELMYGSSWWYRDRQVECSLDERLYRLVMETCSVIGVMSLFI